MRAIFSFNGNSDSSLYFFFLKFVNNSFHKVGSCFVIYAFEYVLKKYFQIF